MTENVFAVSADGAERFRLLDYGVPGFYIDELRCRFEEDDILRLWSAQTQGSPVSAMGCDLCLTENVLAFPERFSVLQICNFLKRGIDPETADILSDSWDETDLDVIMGIVDPEGNSNRKFLEGLRGVDDLIDRVECVLKMVLSKTCNK